MDILHTEVGLASLRNNVEQNHRLSQKWESFLFYTVDFKAAFWYSINTIYIT